MFIKLSSHKFDYLCKNIISIIYLNSQPSFDYRIKKHTKINENQPQSQWSKSQLSIFKKSKNQLARSRRVYKLHVYLCFYAYSFFNFVFYSYTKDSRYKFIKDKKKTEKNYILAQPLLILFIVQNAYIECVYSFIYAVCSLSFEMLTYSSYSSTSSLIYSQFIFSLSLSVLLLRTSSFRTKVHATKESHYVYTAVLLCRLQNEHKKNIYA